MLTSTDYDKLQQIMTESPEKKELLSRLLETHRMDISMISHEIRNPLTLVYSALQLIESQHPEVCTFSHWDHLRQDIEYMKLLLEELSSYNNGERLELSLLSPETMLKTLALSFASSLIETDIQFTSYIEPDLPKLNLDILKIRQALLNILGNAKDAVLSASSLRHEIALDAHVDHDQLFISISNTGDKIASEDLDKIFEPFITRKSSGTGLGLAITRRIIEAHDGMIRVSSTDQSSLSDTHGTIFTITLPIQQNT